MDKYPTFQIFVDSDYDFIEIESYHYERTKYYSDGSKKSYTYIKNKKTPDSVKIIDKNYVFNEEEVIK